VPLALQKHVALKVLTSVPTPRKAWLDAFASELRSVARLNHPNILAVYDFGEVSQEAMAASQQKLQVGSPWLAMELAEHGSLNQRGKGMDWAELRGVLLALMDALAHAHAQGLVHRDIKPANILFGGKHGELKLGDFGVAVDVRGLEQEGLEGYAVGTPNYMAPEQFEGRICDLGPWTDLYALGCMVHRLVCGKPPFTALGFRALREAHCTWPVPPMSPTMGVPRGLDAWVRTLLAKNPYARFSCVADTRAALEGLGEAEPWGEVQSFEATPTISSETPVDRPLPVQEIQAQPPVVWPGAEFPKDWRQPEHPQSQDFRGVGLALHGVRTLPFVGRVALRDALWGVFEDVRDSRRPAAIVLEGPAGVGKSRLAMWLAQRTQELGAADYMVGTHDPSGGPDTGIRPMLIRALGLRGASVQGARDRLARRWHEGLDSHILEVEAICQSLVGELEHLETERRALWRIALELSSQQRPLVVVLDDVNWDLESVQFVRWVLDQSPFPVLFVLTVRTEDLSATPGLETVLSELVVHPGGQRLTVPPLEAAESAKLVGEGLGLRGDLAARVQERTAGNPLFAVQLVGDWVGRGVLVPDGEGFHLAPGTEVQLPDDLHATWSARIQALLADRPEAERVALEIAAVLGGAVDAMEWQQSCAAMKVAPGSILEGLLGQGLAHQNPGESTWSFVHGMAREALLRKTREAGRWQAAHQACAQILADKEGQGSRLGRHLLESGQPIEALDPLSRGMDAHLARGELVQAQVVGDQQRRALAALPPVHPMVMWATLQRARLARFGGRIRAAEEELVGARELSQTLKHVAGEAQVCTEEALTAYRSGRLEQVMEASTRGEALALQCGDHLRVAQCLEVRARASTDRARFEEATQIYERARAAFDDLGDALGMASCDLGLGWVALSVGQFEAARSRIEAALDVLGQLGARSIVATAHNLLGEVHRALGEKEQAAVHYTRSLALHRACGSQGGASTTLLNLALVQVQRGDFAEAQQRVSEVLGTMATHGLEQFLGAAQLIALVCDAGQGHWAQWSERFAKTEALLNESGQVHEDLRMLAEKAAHLARQGGQPREATQAEALAKHQRAAMDGP
jgi:tetratricopeptide (TPR) repeat protein